MEIEAPLPSWTLHDQLLQVSSGIRHARLFQSIRNTFGRVALAGKMLRMREDKNTMSRRNRLRFIEISSDSRVLQLVLAA